MVCPKIRFAWEPKPIQFAGYTPLSSVTLRNKSIGYNEPDNGQYNTPHPTPYAHGAAMMIKRDALEQVGLMPECYFLYYEELDWSMMFTRGGFEIWYEPAATIYHKESQTTGANSPLKTYYICRNRLLFAQLNITGQQRLLTYCYLMAIVIPKDIIKALVKGRFQHISALLRGVRDFYTLSTKLTKQQS
jgi:GT2 family glycosyltransferase